MEHELIKDCSVQEMKLLSIILYTDKHPHLKKCLRDDDYWNSLDARSGLKWRIFAVRPIQGVYLFPKPGAGFMQMMIKIWEEPADNISLIDFLGLDDTQNLPLMFFYKLNNDEIDDSIYIKIEGNTEEEVYNCLQEIIDKVSKSLEKDGDFFENAKSTINRAIIYRTIKKGKKILSDFNSLIPGFL